MLVASGFEFGDACVAASGQLPQVVGNIQAAIGCSTVRRANGIAVQVMAGDPVCEGDVIETAADGRIEILFVDGTVFSLSRDTRVALGEFARDSVGTLRSALLAVTRGTFAFVAGRLANTGSLTVDTPVGSIRSRAQAGGIGILSLAALTFSLIKEARAADPNVTFLDDDSIAYKDLKHGVFELVTKEAIPRHIVVEDPGETVVLSRRGSSVSVNQVANSPAQMEELQAAQQDVLANFAKGFGPAGSSTPPFLNPQQLLQPINFTQTDPTHPLNSLPPLESAVFTVPQVFFAPPPPTPTLAITSIGGQIAIAGDDIINAAKADAGVEITGATSGVEDGRIVTVAILDGANHVVYSGTATVNHGAWLVDVSPAEAKALADGFYTLTADVSNAAGHSAEASQAIRVDETPPTIAIESIARSNVVNAHAASTGFAISGTASDAENGQPVTVTIVDGSGHVVDTFTATLNNNAWSVNVSPAEARLLHDGSYTVTADVSDSAGNPAPQAKQALTVDETPPTVTWLPQAESGVEGTTIALGTITATVNSLPGYSDSMQSLVVSGIPVGAVVTDGTNCFVATNGNTSIDVKGWNLSDLKIVPPNDTNFTLTVTATDQAANTASASELVTVNPLAPCLNPVAAQGNEDTAIALNLGVTVKSLPGANGDASPNSLATLVVNGIPVGATLSDGAGHSFTATAGDTSYDVAGWNLSGLKITPPAEFEGCFTLTITATERDAEGNVSPTAMATEVVKVAPVAEPPTACAPATLTFDEDAACVAITGVRVGPLAEDNDDTVTATLTVSHGTLHVASLNGVTVTGDNCATLTLSGSAAAVNKLLAGLIYTPTWEYEGCDTLHLTVTSSDGSSTYPTAATASTAIRSDTDDLPTEFGAAATTNSAGAGSANPSAAPDNSQSHTAQTSGLSGDGTADTPPARQTFTVSPTKGSGGTFPTAPAGARGCTPDHNGAVNALDTSDTPTGIICAGPRSATIFGGNGSDVVIGALAAILLANGGGHDSFANSPAANATAAQFDTITDFLPGTDKIDLTALGSLASALLALTSSSTSVPAHTIAYEGKAAQTIVYVNPTGHPLSIGDTGLLEIHLPVATVQLSDFVLAPAKASMVAAAGDPIDQAVTTQNDATVAPATPAVDSSDAPFVTASTSDASFDGTVHGGAHHADVNWTAEATSIGDTVDAARDPIDSIDHTKLASVDDGGTPSTEDGVDDTGIPLSGGPSTAPASVAGTTPLQTSFVPDQKPMVDGAHDVGTGPGVEPGSGVLKTPASGGGSSSSAGDTGEQATPMHDAGPHDFEPSSIAQVVFGEGVGMLGDSFYFRDEMSGFKVGVIFAELDDIRASMSHHEDAPATHGLPAIPEGGAIPDTLGDSFHFKGEIFSPRTSAIIDFAGPDRVQTPTSYFEAASGAHVPPAIPEGGHATELLSPEQHLDNHFNLVPHHTQRALAAHVSHDLFIV